MSQLYIISRGNDRKQEGMSTFIHTKLNFKSWHEMHQVMMHHFHTTAKGIATCHLGAEEIELRELIPMVPGHLQVFQPKKKKKKWQEVASSKSLFSCLSASPGARQGCYRLPFTLACLGGLTH